MLVVLKPYACTIWLHPGLVSFERVFPLPVVGGFRPWSKIQYFHRKRTLQKPFSSRSIQKKNLRFNVFWKTYIRCGRLYRSLHPPVFIVLLLSNCANTNVKCSSSLLEAGNSRFVHAHQLYGLCVGEVLQLFDLWLSLRLSHLKPAWPVSSDLWHFLRSSIHEQHEAFRLQFKCYIYRLVVKFKQIFYIVDTF